MSLQGKIALVTGAALGIGRGCAIELARAGAKLIVNDRELTGELNSLIAEIEGLGSRAVPIAGDVFQRETCEQVVREAIAVFGRIDILVSNPARGHRSSFLEHSPERFREVLAGTLTSGFDISQLVARHMVSRSGAGKIIFISSVLSRIPSAGSSAYNAAKAGLNHLAATIAAELLPHRINVNAIEPGWIDTPGERKHFGDAYLEKHGPLLPWGRLGLPADIGKVAAFLASEDADYITGTTLLVDGGFALKAAIQGDESGRQENGRQENG